MGSVGELVAQLRAAEQQPVSAAIASSQPSLVVPGALVGYSFDSTGSDSDLEEISTDLAMNGIEQVPSSHPVPLLTSDLDDMSSQESIDSLCETNATHPTTEVLVHDTAIDQAAEALLASLADVVAAHIDTPEPTDACSEEPRGSGDSSMPSSSHARVPGALSTPSSNARSSSPKDLLDAYRESATPPTGDLLKSFALPSDVQSLALSSQESMRSVDSPEVSLVVTSTRSPTTAPDDSTVSDALSFQRPLESEAVQADELADNTSAAGELLDRTGEAKSVAHSDRVQQLSECFVPLERLSPATPKTVRFAPPVTKMLPSTAETKAQSARRTSTGANSTRRDDRSDARSSSPSPSGRPPSGQSGRSGKKAMAPVVPDMAIEHSPSEAADHASRSRPLTRQERRQARGRSPVVEEAPSSPSLVDTRRSRSSSRSKAFLPPPKKKASKRPREASPLRSSKKARAGRSDASAESNSDAEVGSDQSDAPSSDEKSACPSGRRQSKPKGDLETRAREHLMAHPDLMFADADCARTDEVKKTPKKAGKRSEQGTSKKTAKGAPSVVVPPLMEADRVRPRRSVKSIAATIAAYVADPTAVIHFTELQPAERLQVIRGLLPVAFAGAHQVEPLIRLLCQNGRTLDDPLASLAANLWPALIDTRRCTHASNAQQTIFNYLFPLFLQRWGIMSTSTSAPQQWRAIGQMHNNWNGGGRWPELLIAAPLQVASWTRELFAEGVVSSDFQNALGARFVEDPAALARWCYIRRCARSLNTDKTGKSVFVDLIVPPLAVWLRPFEPDIVTAALAAAETEALSADVTTRLEYPSTEEFGAAVTVLTEVLANANPQVVFGRLVNETLLGVRDRVEPSRWLKYAGIQTAILTGVQCLQSRRLPTFDATLSSASADPAFILKCQWPETIANSSEVLTLVVPLQTCASLQGLLERASSAPPPEFVTPALPPPNVRSKRPPRSRRAAGETSSATSSTATSATSNDDWPAAVHSTALSSTPSRDNITIAPLGSAVQVTAATVVVVSGLAGVLAEETLRDILQIAGTVRCIHYDEAGSRFVVEYERAESALATVICIYCTATRSRSIRAITTAQLPDMSATVISVPIEQTNQQVDADEGGLTMHVFGTHKRGGDLNTSLLLARPQQLPPSEVVNTVLAQILEQVAAQQAYLLASSSSTLSVESASARLARDGDVLNDHYATRAVLAALFADASACPADALLAVLREVVVEHLQQHVTDRVYVTPLDWLDTTAGLDAAILPSTLFVADNEEINVAECRVLFCPLMHAHQPALFVLAFPQSLSSLNCRLNAPFIALLGTGLTQTSAQTLLVFLLFRLETLLGSPVALVRPNLIVFNYGPAEQLAGEELFTAQLRLGHAARVFLQLVSTTDCLPLCAEFLTDDHLLTTTRTTLQTRCEMVLGAAKTGEKDIPPEQTGNVETWRALTVLSKTAKPLTWTDAIQLAAYNQYVMHRYQKALNRADWASSSSVRKIIQASSAKSGHEMVLCELREVGQFLLRAFCARLQQLHQYGFHPIGNTGNVIDLCRRATEHVTLSLPDFALHQGSRVLTAAEETAQPAIGRGTAPYWSS